MEEKENKKGQHQQKEEAEHSAARGRILSHGGTPQTTPQTPSALDLIKSFNASVRHPDNLERKVCVCTRPLPERWCPGALFLFLLAVSCSCASGTCASKNLKWPMQKPAPYRLCTSALPRWRRASDVCCPHAIHSCCASTSQCRRPGKVGSHGKRNQKRAKIH